MGDFVRMSLQRSNHMAEREANRVARETNTRIDMDMNVVEPEKPKVNWYPPGADASGEQRTFTEANKHLAQLARNIIAANGFSDRITVINKMSTEMTLEDMPDGEPADMIISEILGTLMLGESALEYIADARERLLKPGGAIIPNRGCQYAQLVSAADLEAITTVSSWGGIDLSLFNTLQDTVSIVFTKQYGFRFSSMPHTYMSERICVADIDFSSDSPGVLGEPQHFLVQAKDTGTVHAVL